jgi:hypothetical protein
MITQTRTTKKGDAYIKLQGASLVDISQEEKDELDSLESTHQGDCPDFSSMISVSKIVRDNSDQADMFVMVYTKTDTSKSAHRVTL